MWANGYLYRTTAVVASAQITGTLTNWPALVSLSSANLKSTANGGAVQNTVTQTVGGRSLTVPADFFVTSDAPGSTQITGVEFESYDATAGTALIWVKVASAAVGSTIYIFYGNASVTTLQGTPSGAWNSNYLGVWHLPDGTTLDASDSTTHGNNGTNHSATAATGKIDGGVASNGGGSQYISMGANVTSLHPTPALTVQIWCKPLSATQNNFAAIIAQDYSNPRGSPFSSYKLGLNFSNGGQYCFEVGANGTSDINTNSGVSFSNGTWAHVVGSYNSGTITVYVNGVKKATAASGGFIGYTSSGDFRISGNSVGGEQVNAAVDEARVMNVAVSDAWVAADYNNQSAPGTFWTITYDETNVSPPIGKIGGASTAVSRAANW